MNAIDVITFGRDTMLGFDSGFLPSNGTLLYPRLSQTQRKVVEELLRLDNMALALPGDQLASSVSVSGYAAAYALPATLWRIRQATLSYSSGKPRPIRIIPSGWRNNIPQDHPSMYIVGSSFYPIDNGSTRIFGWSAADAVLFDFVTEPVNVTDDGDVLAAPDEAWEYLGYDLAYHMAIRGKVADATMREIKGMREESRARLMALAKSQPGADPYPPGS